MISYNRRCQVTNYKYLLYILIHFRYLYFTGVIIFQPFTYTPYISTQLYVLSSPYFGKLLYGSQLYEIVNC